MVYAPEAAAQTRSLKIYHVNSHEKATIVFKRNGRYDQSGLKKLNMILRDWRRNEPTRMDPRLFDLIWEVYQKSGSNGYINVIGGYRAPATNAMLRSRSKGVAEKSQHILGKAMDFYIPGVPLKKLREIGIKFQVGGVGFYPTSGSPFVHMDVGGVRAWPRMPRRELARLFPDGRTLHRPAEGGTMPGYAAALADYKRRMGSNEVLVAGGNSKNTDNDQRQRKSLLAALFSSGDENEEDIVEASNEVADVLPDKKRKPKTNEAILTAAVETDKDIKAPVPLVRPAINDDQPTLETALLSLKKNSAEEAMQAALTPQAAEPVDEQKAEEFVNLAKYHIPVPELLGDRKQPGDGDVLTASIDSDAADLGMVPVPALRPEDAAELAKADIDVPEPDLKPEEIAALAAESGRNQDTSASTDEDEVADMLDSLDAADTKSDGQDDLAEMAALDMPSNTATRSLTIPLVANDASEPKVIKGGRPKKSDAAAADDTSTVADPKLTRNLIAQWAITKGRVDLLSKPVKAPRFVSRTLRKQPTEVYADGFVQNTAYVDPARFSGTAVNFMPVKKFEAID